MAAFGRGTRTVGVREMWAAIMDTDALRLQMPRLAWAGLAVLLGLITVGLTGAL